MPPEPEAVWNSLEVVKLIVSALTPLAVLIGGWWLNRRLKRIEHLQWTNQKVIEKRIEVYDEVAPLLNDLLCYFTFVGCWKDLEPTEVVSLKRKLDRLVHVNAPLFSSELLDLYNGFVGSLFSTFTGWGQDARLRTHPRRRKEAAGDEWKQSWDNLFDVDGASEPAQVRDAYSKLMSRFAAELGVGVASQVPQIRIPVNHR